MTTSVPLEQQTSLQLWSIRHREPFYSHLDIEGLDTGLILCNRQPVARFASDADAVRTLVLDGYEFDAGGLCFRSTERQPRPYVLNELLEFDPDKFAGQLITHLLDESGHFKPLEQMQAAAAAKLKELCLP